MRLVRGFLTFIVGGVMLVCAGCAPNASLKATLERTERERDQFQRELQAERTSNEQLQVKLGEQEYFREQIEKQQQKMSGDFDQLSEMHKSLLLRMAEGGGSAGLPAELSEALMEFAQANGELLSYDSAKSLVRLKSDLTFDLGSDKVKAEAEPVLVSLGEICSKSGAQGYRLIIVGHTDDMPIVRAETRAKHPTNWHLSVHRAIAVKDVLEKSLSAQQMGVMGFGEFRPMAKNLPGNKGNPLNRRVEIYIVPAEAAVPSGGI